MSNTDEFANAVEAGASGDTWDFENQKVLIGTFKARKSNVGRNNSMMYVIDEDGKQEPTNVWGSTVLDGRFSEIPVGSRVRIEYLGKVKGNAVQPYKDYSVKYIVPEGVANVQQTMGGGEVVPTLES